MHHCILLNPWNMNSGEVRYNIQKNLKADVVLHCYMKYAAGFRLYNTVGPACIQAWRPPATLDKVVLQ